MRILEGKRRRGKRVNKFPSSLPPPPAHDLLPFEVEGGGGEKKLLGEFGVGLWNEPARSPAATK